MSAEEIPHTHRGGCKFFSLLFISLLTNPGKGCIISDISAGVAHLVERHLAKVEVASSSLVVRSNL